MMNKIHKLLAVVGPTASGKSDLAVEVALLFNGEVISADSRQVYEGLDIGTGKITKEEMRTVPHHLLDVVDPQEQFSVAEYKKLADRAVADIHARDKLPILAGGTGFYIHAVVDDLILPEVPPNTILRQELSSKSAEDLLNMLREIDPHRAETVEQKNPRRLIRSIEIAHALGSVPRLKRRTRFDTLQIGISVPEDELREKIRRRLIARTEGGMIEEAERLHAEGLTYERMEELGLEYRYLARYLQGSLSKDEFVEQLSRAIWQYAKRQMTWFKKDTRIEWFNVGDMESIIERVRAWQKS